MLWLEERGWSSILSSFISYRIKRPIRRTFRDRKCSYRTHCFSVFGEMLPSRRRCRRHRFIFCFQWICNTRVVKRSAQIWNSFFSVQFGFVVFDIRFHVSHWPEKSGLVALRSTRGVFVVCHWPLHSTQQSPCLLIPTHSHSHYQAGSMK